MLDEFRLPVRVIPANARVSRAANRRSSSILASVIALAAATFVLAVFGVGGMLDRLRTESRSAEQDTPRVASQPGG
jgi:hypothetical protein